MQLAIRVLGLPLLISSALAWISGPNDLPENAVTVAQVEAHLRFLASDELAGRRTGTPGNDVAARYIAEQFRAAGVEPLPELGDYFQAVPLLERIPPVETKLEMLDQQWALDEDLLVISGGGLEIQAPVAYSDWLSSETSADGGNRGSSLKDRIAFTKGTGITPYKRNIASREGALALVELVDDHLWNTLSSFWKHSAKLFLPGSPEAMSSIPHLLIRDPQGQLQRQLQEGSQTQAFLKLTEERNRSVRSSNVVGIIRGSDPKLRNEYVALVAHYDHVGADPDHPRATAEDHIFNGAIDNGMGTVALLSAARSLGRKPPSRSVLLVAATAEEQGLLGSSYLVQKPPVPLEKIIFVLNSDGGALTDRKVVTVLGLDRTSAKAQIASGCRDFGLEAISGPADVQYLFNQSDNLSFAQFGIPSPTFSPGFRTFDRQARRRYHRPSDEAGDDFDYPYLQRFAQAFSRVARYVADHAERPRWTTGDRYEAAAQELYGASYR